MKLNNQRILILVVSGLLLGNLVAPNDAFPFLGKLAGKVKKAAELSVKVYKDLDKDVELLMADKKKLEADVQKVMGIPAKLEAVIADIAQTVTLVKDDLVTTGKHIVRTGKDVAKIKKIYKALD